MAHREVTFSVRYTTREGLSGWIADESFSSERKWATRFETFAAAELAAQQRSPASYSVHGNY